MEVNRVELLEAVRYAMVATTKDPTILGSHCIAFSPDAIHSFNDWVGTTINITTGITGNYDAIKLMKALSSWKTETIIITSTDIDMTMKAGKSSVTLINQDVPVLSRLITNKITTEDVHSFDIPKNFTTLLKNGILSNENAKTLGVYISGCDIIATNNAIIYHAVFEGNVDPMRLSSKAIMIVDKFSPEKVKITPTWILFYDDTKQLLVRQLITDGYPFAQFKQGAINFVNGNVLAALEYKPEILDVVKTVQTYCDFHKPDVQICLLEGFTISTNATGSTFESTIETTMIVPNDTQYTLKVQSLLNVLKNEPLVLRIIEGKNRNVFVAVGENSNYIVGVEND